MLPTTSRSIIPLLVLGSWKRTAATSSSSLIRSSPNIYHSSFSRSYSTTPSSIDSFVVKYQQHGRAKDVLKYVWGHLFLLYSIDIDMAMILRYLNAFF